MAKVPETTLVIGDKQLSSWSLRAWIWLVHHRVRFDEVVVRLDQPDTRERILRYSPTGRVPALVHGGVTAWDSLAVCVQATEWFGLRDPWPADAVARAHARSAAAEMHSSFQGLRRDLSFRALRDGVPAPISDEGRRDIERVQALWQEARARFGGDGPWLYGSFGIADAMYVPVALRFAQYAVPMSGAAADYVRTVRAHPGVVRWIDEARREPPASPDH